MVLVYANANYEPNRRNGGTAHIRQFVQNVIGQGHEVKRLPWEGKPIGTILPDSRIKRFMELRKVDVVYIRNEHSPSGYCRWGMSPYRQLLGEPLFVWEFNTVPEFGIVAGLSEAEVQSNIQLFKRYGRGCDLAVCVSHVLADYVREDLGIGQTLTVPNGSDPDLFRPDAPPVRYVQRTSECLNVVWIGSAFLPWNNFELLNKAAEMLWEGLDRTKVRFYLIGPGLESIKNMPPNILYCGSEDYYDLPRWLAAMDVGLVLYIPGPSDYGSPMKLFDYMASGLAVVGTEQPQLREIFHKLEQPDLIVPPDDPGTLVNILIKLAQDRERVRRQGQMGRELTIKSYNWRVGVKKILNGIEYMLKNRKG